MSKYKKLKSIFSLWLAESQLRYNVQSNRIDNTLKAHIRII